MWAARPTQISGLVLKHLSVMKKAKQPNEEEFSVLKSIAANDNRKKVRLRAKIILNRLKGFSTTQIIQILRCSKNTVKKCIEIWNRDGIGSIVSWKRKNFLGKQFKRRNAIEKLISVKPKSLNFPFTNWSLRTIKAFLSDWLNLKLSLSTIRRDLKVINFKYKKIEEKLFFKPADYGEKKAVLTLLKRFKREKTRIVYIDEKGPIPILRHAGRVWTPKHIIEDKRKKKQGMISFLGGFDPVDYEFYMNFLYDHTSESFCRALGYVMNKFLVHTYDKLLLVMDNAFIHHSNFTTEYLKWQDNVEVFFLPTYSPELNPIELCFNQYQRELINNFSINSGAHLFIETRRYVDYFNTQRKRIMEI